mgnify:CR=1 FL=1
MNIKWNQSAKDFLKKHAETLTDEEIADKLSVLYRRKFTQEAVRKKRIREFGLHKAVGRPRVVAEKKVDVGNELNNGDNNIVPNE